MKPATSLCARTSGVCMHQPDCEDAACPGRPAAAPCSSCDRIGVCLTPQACMQPEPAARASFRPTYDIAGPYRRLRRPRSLGIWLAIAFTGTTLVLAGVVLPLIHRFGA